MATVATVHTVSDLRAQVAAWRADGLRVGLVPTMGALHAGHISLIERMQSEVDRVITTIFVNPTQFGAGEDLGSYPRTLAEDSDKIAAVGGQLVFAPSVSEVYPDGFSTRVVVDGLTDVLCGAARPTHFDGVTQVVAKLLNMAGADVAIFGEKDWQQLAVIRRMVRDLDIPVEILGGPIVRDDHGLALSSRNGYLDKQEIAVARQLNMILKKAAYDIGTSGYAANVCNTAAARLLEAGFQKVDYVECRSADDLALLDKLGEDPARIFAAAHIGRARLIDNFPVN